MVQMSALVGLAEIQVAAGNLSGVAVRTPLLASPWSERLWFKPECLQPTGAFKLRGAYHALLRLSPQRRAAGVVTHSSGNHGQALAYAARLLAVPCVVVMPELAAPHKVAATRRLGAEVILVAPAERQLVTATVAAERGLSPVPPFDHPDVIAGQGTVGLEIIADLADLVDSAGLADEPALVLVPVGGGGLAAGVASAVKARRPAVRVVGVEPALAADAQESLVAGELRPWPVEQTYATVADGLRTQLSELTLAHLTAHLDGIVTVTEEEILETTRALLHEARLVVEPSGAVAAAAYRHRRAELPAGGAGRTVAVISGGNLDPALLGQLAAPG
jgi:threonine dehydratase